MRRRAIIATLLGAALIAGAAPAQAPPPIADTIGTTDNDRAQLITAKQAAADAEARAAELATAAAAASTEADRARAQAAALALKVQAAEADITAARARIAIVAKLQADQQHRIAEKQAPILHLTAALQTMARRPAALAIAQPGSVADIVHVRLLLIDTLPVIAQRTAGLRAELQRAGVLRADAERAAMALIQSRQLLSERRRQLAVVEATAIRRAQRLSEQAADEAQRALGLGEEARDIADRMQTQETAAEIRRRLDRLPGPEPRPPGPDDTVPNHAGRSRYILPIQGTLATGFGEVSDAGVTARGVTLAVPRGSPVIAPAPGRILFAGPFRSYGRILIIDHGGGWSTTLTGLDSVLVKVGDTVRQGQPIGRAGPDTPHLTAELRRNGRPIDILAMTQAG